MVAWFESFFDDVYGDVFFRALSKEVLERAAATIVGLLGLSPGDRVLDVPCGNGRVSAPLAQAGLDVVGLDFNARYLDRARRLAAEAGVELALVRGDMRALPFAGAFDAVVNWGGSFGYFPEAGNARFCRRACQALRPGGRLVVETAHLPWLRANFHPCNELVFGGARVRQEHVLDPETGRYESLWTYRRGDETVQRRLAMRLYEPEALRALLERAGFVDIELWGGPPPVIPLEAACQRLVAVATRGA